MTGALEGIRILDLSRILAGPSCAQVLGDLGADVIKVERPGRGDDTRGWGPPFDPSGAAAYYLAANRNKRSIAIDLANDEGVAIVRALALASDVVIENYKTGDLERRGLGARDLLAMHPRLVHCSIRGFASYGPRAEEPGYDFLAQAMGGLMSVTGSPDAPTKAGIGVADLFTGMHAAVAILAALRHRDRTGEGQHVEVALFDAQLAMLANAATDAFVTGRSRGRRGNAHPHIVPYQAFASSDGHVVIAIGNDAQWRRFCEAACAPELAGDERLATNAGRVVHRDELVPRLEAIVRARSSADWLAALRGRGVPCGPVNDVLEAFDDPAARHRGMRRAIDGVEIVASPIRASRTPPTYRRAPPALGAHAEEILREVLGMDERGIERAKRSGALGGDG